MSETLLELNAVSQYFYSASDKKQKILENINLKLNSGEIVAILGKSGSGKSTLLRIIAELYPPTKGKIKFGGMQYTKPSISMVFQTFALFPWLNVYDNVALGLESQGKLSEEQKRRVLECIELIGLDGFEQAMPRELSGGMKQRVGFARGLAMNPDILLLDEPFSALDVLTANTLKNDFLKLWGERKIAVQSVLIITHSIEEAIAMADRILILASSPGIAGATIIAEFKVIGDKPRNIKLEEYQQIEDKIYHAMTSVNNIPVSTNAKSKEVNINQKLPLVLPSEIFALLELLNSKERKGKAEVADLIHILHIKLQHVMRIVESLSIFKFANIVGPVIKITSTGKLIAEVDIDSRKALFAQALRAHVPLSNYICKIIKERPGQKVHKKRFKTHLEDYLTPEQANSTLNAIISWGRYAEIFSYDDNKQIFTVAGN